MIDGTYWALDAVLGTPVGGPCPWFAVQNSHYFDYDTETWVDVENAPFTFKLVNPRITKLEDAANRLSSSLKGNINILTVGIAAQSRYNMGDKLVIYTKAEFERKEFLRICEGIPVVVKVMGEMAALGAL